TASTLRVYTHSVTPPGVDGNAVSRTIHGGSLCSWLPPRPRKPPPPGVKRCHGSPAGSAGSTRSTSCATSPTTRTPSAPPDLIFSPFAQKNGSTGPGYPPEPGPVRDYR